MQYLDRTAVLKTFETCNRPTSRGAENLFFVWMFIMVGLCIGFGWLLHSVKALPPVMEKSVGEIKAQFVFSEDKKPEPLPKVAKQKTPEVPLKQEPVDLTRQPALVEPSVATEEKPQATPAPRAVFGLRRVYSVGLGSGGSMTDAIVGKIGNTISKEYDTVAATVSDIKGTVVSTATVTTAPRFRKVVKPIYTKEMIKQNVAGTVKVKVLVDIDGKVKKATCLNDIGCDSAAQAVKATLAMEFDPAMRGSDPVAVWIIVPIHFVLLG